MNLEASIMNFGPLINHVSDDRSQSPSITDFFDDLVPTMVVLPDTIVSDIYVLIF